MSKSKIPPEDFRPGNLAAMVIFIIGIIVLIIVIAFFALSTDAHAQEPYPPPEWLWANDGNVTVAWFIPQDAYVPAFVSAGALLFIEAGQDYAGYFMYYYGYFNSPLGGYHMFHTKFNPPDEVYKMSAYVLDINMEDHDVLPTPLVCRSVCMMMSGDQPTALSVPTDIYIPLVWRGW